jgi:hypothetical protein
MLEDINAVRYLSNSTVNSNLNIVVRVIRSKPCTVIFNIRHVLVFLEDVIYDHIIII